MQMWDALRLPENICRLNHYRTGRWPILPQAHGQFRGPDSVFFYFRGLELVPHTDPHLPWCGELLARYDARDTRRPEVGVRHPGRQLGEGVVVEDRLRVEHVEHVSEQQQVSASDFQVVRGACIH